jgi:hypothetical protein
MNPHEPFGTKISDRRRHNRRAVQAQVRLSVDTEEVLGYVDNVSRSGLLFFSDGDLRVTVRYEEDGKPMVRSGRLIRAARMRGDSFGWAVEFDS